MENTEQAHFIIVYISNDNYAVDMPCGTVMRMVDGEWVEVNEEHNSRVFTGTLKACCDFIANIDNPEWWGISQTYIAG